MSADTNVIAVVNQLVEILVARLADAVAVRMSEVRLLRAEERAEQPARCADDRAVVWSREERKEEDHSINSPSFLSGDDGLRDEPKRRAARHQPRATIPWGPAVSSRADVEAAIAPLVEFCRRCRFPATLDEAGFQSLLTVDIAGLRYAVQETQRMAAAGSVRSPLGLLVAKARESSASAFFSPPPGRPPSAPATEPVSEPVSELATVPALLSGDDLVHVDAFVRQQYGNLRPGPLLDALRRAAIPHVFESRTAQT
jgi:hypothetical protein